jgi:hypothetical protein
MHSSLAHFHPPIDSYAYNASAFDLDDDASSLDSDDTTSPASNLSRDLLPLCNPHSDDDSDSEDYMPALLYRYSGYDSSDDNMSISSEQDSFHHVFSAPTPDTAPIRVSPKPPKGKRRKNAFIDDRGFPDQSNELDTLLHSMHGKPILRKRRHPAPNLDDIDPAFDFKYDEALHGNQFREDFTPARPASLLPRMRP